jgi:membrane-associated phospholipid phosphatase
MLLGKIIKGTTFLFISLFLAHLINGHNFRIFQFLNRGGQGIGEYFFLWLTMFGDGAIVLLILFYIFGRQSKYYLLNAPLATIGLFSYLSSGLMVQLLKYFFDYARPAKIIGQTKIQILGPVLLKYSFPSGHSASVMSLSALLFLMSNGKTAKVLFLAMGVLVACSRIIIGAHWPIDVFVGGFIGYSATHIIYQGRSGMEGFYQGLYENNFKAFLILNKSVYFLTIFTTVYLQFLDGLVPDKIQFQLYFITIPFTFWAVLGLIRSYRDKAGNPH